MPITCPLRLSSGPPLPPWVVGASNTTSVSVMSAMWPCVVEGRTRPRAASASLRRPVLMPAPATSSRASAASIFASMASIPAGKPTSTTACPVTAPLPLRSSGSVGRRTPREVAAHERDVRVLGVALHA